MSTFVGDVVGELELVERQCLVHPMFTRRWRVWMYVGLSRRQDLVGFAGNHPSIVLELVSVPVDRHNVHQHHVLGTRVEVGYVDLDCGKHSPAKCQSE